jgi:hypothetical protein
MAPSLIHEPIRKLPLWQEGFARGQQLGLRIALEVIVAAGPGGTRSSHQPTQPRVLALRVRVEGGGRPGGRTIPRIRVPGSRVDGGRRAVVCRDHGVLQWPQHAHATYRVSRAAKVQRLQEGRRHRLAVGCGAVVATDDRCRQHLRLDRRLVSTKRPVGRCTDMGRGHRNPCCG